MTNSGGTISNIEKKGGYPAGSKPVSEIKPPPVSVSRPRPRPAMDTDVEIFRQPGRLEGVARGLLDRHRLYRAGKYVGECGSQGTIDSAAQEAQDTGD